MSPTVEKAIKVVCVLPLIGQPRFAKRISMLQRSGFEVEAVAFDRNYHRGRCPDCPVTSLGRIDHGRYLARSLRMLRVIPRVRRLLARSDVVYAFGADMGLLCLIAGCGLRKPLSVEIGDVRELQVAGGIRGWVARAVDAYVARSSRLIVVTAPGFIEEYYRKWLHVRTRALVLENKLEADSDRNAPNCTASGGSEGRALLDRPLRIGYFGLLRHQWAWDVLERLAAARPTQVEIVIAGFPTEPADLPERAARIPNVTYLGEYKSPQDLPRLYGSVDLVWACYPYIEPKRGNFRWARTNRFYESCFYQVPIISRFGCADAVEVGRLGIGLTIKETQVQATVERLCAVGPDDLASWRHNLSCLPKNTHTYTTETEELGKAIRQLAGGSCESRHT